MSALRCLVCSACHVAYVWRLTWRPAERRMEWRPAPDCACNDAFGMPSGSLFVRDECVSETETAVSDLADQTVAAAPENGGR